MLSKTILVSLLIASAFTWEEPKVEPCHVHKTHTHHHHHVPAHSHKVFQANLDKRDTWFDNDDSNGCASGGSMGDGESVVMAGPNGSNSASKGEEGSYSDTRFGNRRQSGRKSFATYSDTNGKKATVSDNWKSNVQNKNKARAVSKGKGASKAVSNTQSSEGVAQGTKGAKVNSVYDNQTKNMRDQWSVHKSKGKNVRARNTWTSDDRMKTAGRAMGVGNGKAKTVSNRVGSVVKAKGDCFSRGDTRHQGQLKQAGNNWIAGKVGNRTFARQKKYKVNSRSTGGTSTMAKGKGGIKSFTNRYKGSGGIAKGTKGTKNKAGYKRKQKRWADNWSTDVVRKGVTVYHPVKKVDHHYHHAAPAHKSYGSYGHNKNHAHNYGGYGHNNYGHNNYGHNNYGHNNYGHKNYGSYGHGHSHGHGHKSYGTYNYQPHVGSTN